MSAPTRGPWVAQSTGLNRESWLIGSPDGEVLRYIAEIRPLGKSGPPFTEVEPNARLLAASWELLEMVKIMDEAINPPNRSMLSLAVWNDGLKSATKRARDLIARIEG